MNKLALSLVALSIMATGANLSTRNNNMMAYAETYTYENGVKKMELVEENEYVNFLGRTYYDSKSKVRFFNYSASGFEVSFYGTKLTAKMVATNANNPSNRPYISVMLDGEIDPIYALVIKLTSAEQDVVLADGLLEGHHTVKVYKRSECEVSQCGIKELDTDGYFEKVTKDNSKMKIEIYGDSLTCGYQVEGKVYDEPFTTRLENALKSYGWYAASELGADLSLISAGGFPVYQSEYTTGWNIKNIPDMFDMASFDFNTTLSDYVKWDNSKFIPDVVVINLGANDGSTYSKCSTLEAKQEFLTGFKNKYMEFIDKINSTYGEKVKIVVCTSMIGLDADIKQTIKDAIKKYSNITTFESNCVSVGGVMPGEGHPNAEMQKYAGHELAEIIKSLNK